MVEKRVLRRRQEKEEESVRIPNWSELHTDLLQDVFKRLSFTYLNRAKLVCSSWYSASIGCVPKQNQIPWLISFPPMSSSCVLFVPEDNGTIYRSRELGIDFDESYCLETCGSWLLLFNDVHDFYILNPLTAERIDLPYTRYSDLFDFKRGRSCFWIDKETKDYLVVIPVRRMFTKKGYNIWEELSIGRYCEDVFYNDKNQELYVHDGRNDINIWDFSEDKPHKDRTVSLPRFYLNVKDFPSFPRKDEFYRKHLFNLRMAVTVSGDFLKVLYRVHQRKTWYFRIYKINQANNKWMPIDSLGDEALIYDMGITVVANGNIPGIKRNSIYFSNRHDISIHYTNGINIFVYDLTTHQIELLPQCARATIPFFEISLRFISFCIVHGVLFPSKAVDFGDVDQIQERDRRTFTISRDRFMESLEQSIIPGLPNDLALRCIAKLSHGYHGVLECVCKGWRDLLRSSDYSSYKAKNGWSGNWLFVLTERSKNQWVAYDPEADRWHQLPRTSPVEDNWHHSGFACVCVSNYLFVIGGCYAPSVSSFPHEKPVVTKDVMRFDPFTKEWKMVASMRTPRTHFACTAVSGKVYVAGGRNLTHSRGIPSAEVYDPVDDRWEELPEMPTSQMDCSGLSYKGCFHVLSDQVGFAEQNSSEVLNPIDKKWTTVEDVWPFSRATQFAVQVMKNDRVYTIVDWGESLIKTRDTDKGEWYNVGSVPSVVLPNHPRVLEAFGYGFAALKDELYVIGGKVLKWEESGVGKFDIVRLPVVRVCNPLDRPLNWRETKPMCSPAGGSIIGCVSLEESSQT